MKGYLTFLIVFAAYLLLISLAQLNTNAKTSDLGSAIWVERYYQVQMNTKEAVVEAAREGASDGLKSYSVKFITCVVNEKCSAECIGTAGAECGPCLLRELSSISIPCIRKEINAEAINKIESLGSKEFDSEIDAEIILQDYDDAVCSSACNPTAQDKDITSYEFVVDPVGVNLTTLMSGFDADAIELYANDDDARNEMVSEEITGIFSDVIPRLLIQGDKINITLSHPGWNYTSMTMPKVSEDIP